MPKGVKLQELRVGDGDVAGRGTIAEVRYEGTLK
jgi:FKBP-type peptidyl-prolyl cis-trans isomerase